MVTRTRCAVLPPSIRCTLAKHGAARWRRADACVRARNCVPWMRPRVARRRLAIRVFFRDGNEATAPGRGVGDHGCRSGHCTTEQDCRGGQRNVGKRWGRRHVHRTPATAAIPRLGPWGSRMITMAETVSPCGAEARGQGRRHRPASARATMHAPSPQPPRLPQTHVPPYTTGRRRGAARRGARVAWNLPWRKAAPCCATHRGRKASRSRYWAVVSSVGGLMVALGLTGPNRRPCGAGSQLHGISCGDLGRR